VDVFISFISRSAYMLIVIKEDVQARFS